MVGSFFVFFVFFVFFFVFFVVFFVFVFVFVSRSMDSERGATFDVIQSLRTVRFSVRGTGS